MSAADRQTDVVLVHPHVEMQDRFYRIARWVTVPPQGLAFLGAVLERAGYSVAIVDANALKISSEQAVREIEKLNPRIVGLTGTTIVANNAADIAKRVKERQPDTVVVMGGAHISAVPEESLDRYPGVDIGVIGEGEETVVELVRALDGGSDLNAVDGLILRENGGLRRTEPRALIDDIDTLPFPAYYLLPDLTRFYQHVVVRVDRVPAGSILISRGCTRGKCTFCSREIYGGRSRIHSAEYAVSYFEHLIEKYGFRCLNFDDEDLLAFRPTMLRVCELMLERNIDLTWAICGRVDMADEELLRIMKRAGCWHISFGIESGNQEILDNIKKQITLDQVRRAVELTRKYGITSKGFFMIGHQGETLETIQQTIDFSKSLGLDYFQISYTVPLPGTELYRRAKEWGEFDADWDELNVWNPVFIPHGLTREILERESLRAFREFYFRPGVLWRMLKRTFASRHVLLHLRDGLRFLGFLRRG